MKYTGSCLCGSITFRADSVKWCGHCHCSLCQRAHGAAFVTWVGVSTDVASFEGEVHWHASSPDSERGFCPACGSTLFFRSERWPGELHIVRANFDAECVIEPRAHGYWETHVSWVDYKDDLPKKVSNDG